MSKAKRLMAAAGICLLIISLSAGSGIWAQGLEAGKDKSLTFYLPFEKDAVAVVSGGDPQPQEKSVPGQLAEGIKGKGMLLDGNTNLLVYGIPGNYNNARGTLEFWVKFLSADMSSHHYLFYEQGPYEPGSSILRIFTVPSGTGLYYNFRDLRSRWSATPFPMQEMMGEWHQIFLTWDKDIGDRLYIDGRFCGHRGGTTKTIVHNFQRGTKQYEKMTIGLSKTDASIVLDEVKIYNRMLSEEEVLQQYHALFPLKMKVSPIILHQGKSSSVNISLTNTQNREVKGDVKYQVTDQDDNVVNKGDQPKISVKPGKTVGIPIPFTPEQAGKYRLAYTFSGLTNLSRSANLYALPRIEAAVQKETHPELKLKLTKSFDCTKDYGPEEYCDDGLSKVVKSPFGAYRETGEKSWSRFAYRFFIDSPHSPYLAVLEYPDDKARIMEIMIDNKTNRVFQTIENGLITGGEFPNSNKLHEFRLLFFPPDEECTIQVMNWPLLRHKTATPAACRSIKIYQVVGGIPAVAFHNLPPANNQRLVGYEEEDTSIIRQFGGDLVGGGVDFEEMYRTLKNAADYMAFVGQNVFAHPLIHYSGALYPSEVTGQSLGRAALHPDYWMDLALELFHQKGIKFIGSICLWNHPGLEKEACLGPDKEGVAKGEETVLQVAWNGDLAQISWGHRVKYDILNPLVEKAILEMVDDILNTYGGHPAFAGISFWLMPLNSLWFDNLKWGYSDRDISLFQKETGIKVPGKVPDPQRFVKRYLFLVKKDEQMKEKWIAWRCKKVKELWMKIYQRVQAKNPDLKLNFQPNHGYDNILDFWKPGDLKSVYNYFRQGGLDMDLYKDIPNFYIGRVPRPNQRPIDEKWYTRDYDLAPANIEPFKNKGANAVWLSQVRREFDRMKYATQLPGYWFTEKDRDGKERERAAAEKSGGIMPHGDFYLEYYANALANFDVRLITDGGITTTALGHERELREFIRAYRTLPAEYFQVFKGIDDPLCVRYRKREDGYYFYLVNREHYPIEARLTFSAAKPFTLLNLASNEPKSVSTSTTVTVGPFRLLSFRAPAQVSLGDVKVSVPKEDVDWLRERVATFDDSLNALKGKGLRLNEETQGEINWIVQEIAGAWAAKPYSRLRHLLDSYRAKRVAMILKDEKLQVALSVPENPDAPKAKPANIAGNYFADPSFEQLVEGKWPPGGKVNVWSYSLGEQHPPISIDQEVFHSGQQSLKITLTPEEMKSLRESGMWVEVSPVKPGGVYAFSIWMKSDVAEMPVRLIEMTTYQVLGKYRYGWFNVGQKWKKYELIMEIPEFYQGDTWTLRLGFFRPENKVPGTIWVDDASFSSLEFE